MEAMLRCEDEKVSESLEEMPEAVQKVCEKIRSVCKGFVCLLCPIPGHLGSSVKDASQLMTCKSPSGLVESMLVPVLQKLKEWNKLWDEVLAKGSATLTHGPEIEKMNQLLKGESEHGGLSEATLENILKRFPELKAATRPGAVSVLEDSFKTSLKTEAEKLLNSIASGEVDQTFSFLQMLVQGLGMFKDSTSLNLVGRLEKSKDKVASRMLVLDLEKHLHMYPLTDDMQSKPIDNTALETLTDLVQKCKGVKHSENVVKGLERAMFWHFRSFFLELRDFWPQSELKQLFLSWHIAPCSIHTFVEAKCVSFKSQEFVLHAITRHFHSLSTIRSAFQDHNIKPDMDRRVDRMLALVDSHPSDAYPFKEFMKQEMSGFKLAASQVVDLDALEASGKDAKERLENSANESRIMTMLAAGRQLAKIPAPPSTSDFAGEELNPVDYVMSNLFRSIMENETFIDCVSLMASKFAEMAKQSHDKISSTCKNLHLPEYSWKNSESMKETQDLKLLVQGAMTAMARINAVHLEEALDTATEDQCMLKSRSHTFNSSCRF